MFGTHVAKSFLKYFLFLLLSGLSFALVFKLASDVKLDIGTVAFLVGSYVFSWLLGLLTPGAPAGLGVRETALSLMLVNFAPVAEILIAVVASRILTIFGDGLYFLFSCLVSRKGLGFRNPKHEAGN